MELTDYEKTQLVLLYEMEYYDYGKSYKTIREKLRKINVLHRKLKDNGLVKGRRNSPTLTLEGLRLALDTKNAGVDFSLL